VVLGTASADLGGTPAAAGATTAAPSLAEATAAALAARASGLVSAAPTASTPAGSAVVGAAVSVGLRAALSDEELLAVEVVRVRGNSGGVAGGGLELDEGTALLGDIQSTL
jgi:hypothetical protein